MAADLDGIFSLVSPGEAGSLQHRRAGQRLLLVDGRPVVDRSGGKQPAYRLELWFEGEGDLSVLGDSFGVLLRQESREAHGYDAAAAPEDVRAPWYITRDGATWHAKRPSASSRWLAAVLKSASATRARDDHQGW